MTNIRIGKDIKAKWSVLTNGQATSLVGRDLTLELHTPTGSIVQLDYEIDFNVITFTYHGIYHERTGRYTLTLWENRGKIGQSVVDKTDAFCLVNRSELESANINSSLDLTTLDLGTSSFRCQCCYTAEIRLTEEDKQDIIKGVLARLKVDMDELPEEPAEEEPSEDTPEQGSQEGDNQEQTE